MSITSQHTGDPLITTNRTMIEIETEHLSEEWFDLRRGIPTASEAYKIITPKTGKLAAAAELYIGELIAETIIEPEEVDSKWMARGRELEQEAIDWYAFHTDQKVQPGGIILMEDVHVGEIIERHCTVAAVSPDGKIGDSGLLEIKCLMPANHVRYILVGGLPDEFKPQVHMALHISQRKWLDLLCYCPGFRPLLVRVVPNDYTKKLGAALRQFISKLNAAKAQIFEE